MNSSRPYLIRALYEWITDNGLTPHILVDATKKGILVPEEQIRDGKVILNLSPLAVRHLQLGNELIECSARFAGVPCQISVPITTVLAIYARENGKGMIFPEPDSTRSSDEPEENQERKPHLTVVK